MRRLLILLPLLASPAAAQEIPVCDTARAGAVACLAGKLCSCGFARGGSIAGRPDGYRWDCGALRPPCGEALPPAALNAVPAPLPQLYLQLPPPGLGEPPPSMTPWRR
jgi:hypothetical protein